MYIIINGIIKKLRRKIRFKKEQENNEKRIKNKKIKKEELKKEIKII